ncbi:MAG: MerR family transcriptional regulator, partial [Clostridia bacterium]|nr:MerR family transcriptional regulator [Clostridia bacterium]
MTIKEMEARTGLDRANIRFYEKEGLLAPGRLANGYRDYTEQDADTLLRIKLLRSLHISLDEIRALQQGNQTLENVLGTHLHTLAKEKQTLSAAEDVCRAMQEDRARFENLNAEKYLDRLARGPQTEPARSTPLQTDTDPHPMHPWRRLFARTLDYNLYLLPLELICLLGLHLNPASPGGRIATAVSTVLAYVLMLCIEPVLLHFFGTTPGKWLFGLHITNYDGTRLTYEEGIQRTWNVIRYGYGYGAPVYNLYRQWQCYKLCVDGEEQPWDEFPRRRLYTIRDTKPWRGAAWFLLTTAIAFVNLWATQSSALPPNRGDLTVAAFAENFNYLRDYYTDLPGTEYTYTLDETGAWRSALSPDPWNTHTVIIGDGLLSSDPTPFQYFTDTDGTLTGFCIENENGTFWEIVDPSDFVYAALAFINAQPEGGAFSGATRRVATQMDT